MPTKDQPTSEPSRDAAPAEIAVETVDLTRRFGELVAVDALRLTIRAGLTFGLLGPNGAGKSTAIKMLTTLLPPTSGTRARRGLRRRSRARARPRADRLRAAARLGRRSAHRPGEPPVLGQALRRAARGETARESPTSLAFMGLTDAAPEARPHLFGRHGPAPRAGAGHAPPARVLFLDEPTVGLDPVARRAVWETLRELQRTFATTIVLTTHDMEEADHLCAEIALMHAGQDRRARLAGEPQGGARRTARRSTTCSPTTRAARSRRAGRFADVRQSRTTAQRLG